MNFGWVTNPAEVLDKRRWEGLTGTPFQSYGWQKAWRQSFAPRAQLLGLEVTEGDDRVAYWTFVRSRGVCRTLTPMGLRGSDYLPPLLSPDIESGGELWDVMLEGLRQAPDTDVLSLRRQREDQTPLPLFGESTCLAIELPATYAQYEKRLSKSLRADIHRGSKLQVTEGEDNLEILFALHAQRWRSRGWPGVFSSRVKGFHKRVEVDRSIYTVWHEDSPIGSLYALHDESTTYFYQSGFDPLHFRLSPGTVLIAHAIRKAIEQGHTRFDFLRGDEPYKRRWKPTEEFVSGSYVEGLSPIGVIGAAALKASGRIERAARSRFEGRSLIKSSKPN